ncbi:poly-gamma-glutamate hydrolase family protein [Staphylococcus nepalensis]|uniref:poly-gamma-glutamate hydrolase family protein n=1 Tax=Staphylococcus nepalensis TaxID=214473 RepID=UPI00226E8D0D|nr:poly-gamma-glutamate hydrolase family protein [Staphylococcus nepalensis]MCY1039358.1 poly-gamma-glutamate hydrolase family protein [Staphylococcus nepalensis]
MRRNILKKYFKLNQMIIVSSLFILNVLGILIFNSNKSDASETHNIENLNTINAYHINYEVANRNPDKYESMEELQKETKKGVDWKINTEKNDSDTIIAAMHGGAIEPGTTELAKYTARLGNYDYFSFEGIRSENNSELHVTSVNYNNDVLHNMVSGKQYSVMIHGYKGDKAIAYIGGKDKALRLEITDELKSKGIKAEEAPDLIEGRANSNPANMNEKGEGVQIEMTTALREQLFSNNDLSSQSRSDESNYSATMLDMAKAINQAINKVKIEE